MKFTARLAAIVSVALLAYLAVSWYIPRRAAKRDLAGIETRLENIERDLAILVDRVGGARTAPVGTTPEDSADGPQASSDQRVDHLVEALEGLTRALSAQAIEASSHDR